MQTDSQKIDLIFQNLTRVLSILENDPNTNTKGLVEQVRNLTNDVHSLLDWKKELTFKAGVFGFIGGVIMSVVVWAIEMFLTHRK